MNIVKFERCEISRNFYTKLSTLKIYHVDTTDIVIFISPDIIQARSCFYISVLVSLLLATRMEQIDRRQSQPTVFFSNAHNKQYIDVSQYLLKTEIDRRRSFVDNDWKNQHVQFNDLALLGLYFFKKPDVVKCYFCNVDLSEFEANDNIFKEHLKFSPNCPLLRRRKTTNVPLDAGELDKILPPASYDECGSTRRKSSVKDTVAYPDYRIPSKRMNSFGSWPVGIKQKPENLSDAGFFYNGQSDITICFSCGLVVNEWEEADDPWIVHKSLAEKDCAYLRLNQSQIKKAEKKIEQIKEGSYSKPLKTNHDDDDSEEEIDNETMCKICFKRKSSLVFLPCKHVAVCGQCVFGIGKNCPICRSPIEESIALIYA